MVLPGWNVTEPLQVAKEFYVFVRKFQAAPEKIKAFASQVENFSHILRSIDDCIQDPNPVPISDYENLKLAAVSFKKCAEDCQNFIEQFFEESGYRAGRILRWIWKKEQASDLQTEMYQQIQIMSLYINIANLKHRQASIASTTSPNDTKLEEPRPLTPKELFGLDIQINQNQESKSTAKFQDFQAAQRQDFSSTEKTQILPCNAVSCDLHNFCQNSRRSSLTEYLPLEIIQRRGSNGLCYPSQDTTLENLSGVSLCSKIEGDEGKQIQKIELLKDDRGITQYMVITIHTQPKTMIFQKLPSLPRPIPHSEHPIAYRNQTVYRVKFLHHLQLPPQTWSSSKRTTTGSSATPSEHGFSTPSNYESPYTPPSSCMSSPINLGSPQLPASSIKVIEEGELPIFDFRLKEDYKRFQEIIIGKDLLLNAPVDTIISKAAKNSEHRDETEKQYLRLWKSGQSQSIMYYANLLTPFDSYLEYDIECFRPVESKPTSSKLVLEVKKSGTPAITSPKKQGSLMSALSSPLSIGRGSKHREDVDLNHYGKLLPETLRDLKSLAITFTDTEDKVSFLDKAKFYGIPNSSMLPPLPFESPAS